MNHYHCGADYAALPGNFQRIDACLSRSMSLSEARNLLSTQVEDPQGVLENLVRLPGTAAVLLDDSSLLFMPNSWVAPVEGSVICERLPADEAVLKLWEELRRVSAAAYVTVGFEEYPNERMFDALKGVSSFHAVSLKPTTELVDGQLLYTYKWENLNHEQESTQGGY